MDANRVPPARIGSDNPKDHRVVPWPLTDV